MLTKLIKKIFRSEKKKVVAVINLHGVISPSSSFGKSALNLDSLKENIDKAFEQKNLVAVALSVNSPGGSPVQSSLIQNYINSKAKLKKVPVYSFIEDVGASGGYWLACAAEEIYANASSIIGSIGVISAGFGFVEAINKLGIERRIVAEGSNKSVYDAFSPAQKKDVEIIKKIQKQIHAEFISFVSASRGERLDKSNKDIFSGLFWAGNQAKDLGLIDDIGDMYSVLENKFGKKLEIIIVSKPKSWLQRKFGIDSFIDQLMVKFQEKLFLSKYGL